MSIDGLGPQIVELLLEQGCIADVADLYTLTAEQIAPLDRMGEKSAKNLIDAITRSKEAGLERLIFALGIRNVGAVAAAALAAHAGSLEACFSLTHDQLCTIDDFGTVTADCVVNFFSHPQNRALCSRLIKAGLRTDPVRMPTGDSLAGMTFVLTGTLPLPQRSVRHDYRSRRKGFVLSFQENDLRRGRRRSRLQADQGSIARCPRARRRGFPCNAELSTLRHPEIIAQSAVESLGEQIGPVAHQRSILRIADEAKLHQNRRHLCSFKNN